MRKSKASTPTPTTETPTIAPEAARRALVYDLGNLLRKVQRGVPLTRAERELLNAYTRGNSPAEKPQFVSTQEELARQCGVSPQLIAYRMRQPGHPPRTPAGFGVAEWKEWLHRVCRPGTLPTETRKHRRDTWAETFGDGLLAGHSYAMDRIAEPLAAALSGAGVTTTAEQRDHVTCSLWLITAATIHSLALKNGCKDTPLTPTDGETFPEPILAAAKRIGMDLDAELAKAGFRQPAAVS